MSPHALPRPRLTWGELFLVLVLIGFLIATPIALVSVESSGFFLIFWFTFLALAAFLGLSPAVLWRSPRLRYGIALALVAGSLWLRFRHASLISSSTVNWLISLTVIIALIHCLPVCRQLPRPLRRLALPVTHAAWLGATLSTLLLPSHLFLPEISLPPQTASLLSLYLVAVFGCTFTLSLLVGLWLAWRSNPFASETSTGFLASEISRRTKIKLLLGSVATLTLVGTGLYFLPGTCSGSGRFSSASDKMSPALVEQALRAAGCRDATITSGAIPARPDTASTALLEYPTSAHHAILIAVNADGSAHYTYGKVSGYEAGKVHRAIDTICAGLRGIPRGE